MAVATHELTEAVGTHIRPTRASWLKIPGWKQGGSVANPEAPPLALELLGVDSSWGEKSHFSLAIFVIGSFPCPRGLPHAHVHTDSTNWIQWIRVNE